MYLLVQENSIFFQYPKKTLFNPIKKKEISSLKALKKEDFSKILYEHIVVRKSRLSDLNMEVEKLERLISTLTGAGFDSIQQTTALANV